MAYFTSIFDTWRRLATYVDRVLKGAKPGDLPVEQGVKFELVVNLKAAKAIGLSISDSMLLRADSVIEGHPATRVPRALRCMSPFVALFGHVTMSDLSPQRDPKRTLLNRSHLSRFYEYTL